MQSHRKKISESSIQRIIYFLFKVIKMKASCKAKPSLKVFRFYELKIKALRYSDANKNIRFILWILFRNLTSLHPILRNAHQASHIASSTIPIYQYQTVIVLPFRQNPFSSKVFLFFHLKPFRIQRLRLRESPINDDE